MTDSTVRALDAQIKVCANVRAMKETSACKLAVMHFVANKHDINELAHMTTDFAQLLVFLGFEAAKEQALQVSQLEVALQGTYHRIDELTSEIEGNQSLISALKANITGKAHVLETFGKEAVDAGGSFLPLDQIPDVVIDNLLGDGTLN